MSALSAEMLRERIHTPILYRDTADSTNDLAIDWLQSGAVHGSAVLADEQLKGRGRLGRTWYTPPGVALALSVILKPDIEALSAIGIAGAVSVAMMCKGLGIEGVSLKWPNDVRIHGRKVCGILPEAVWQGDQLLGVVLGIGVNVSVQFTGDLSQTATSLAAEIGRDLDRAELAADLIARVIGWSAKAGSDELFMQWRSSLDTIGRQVTVGEVAGLAIDVERSGALLIQQTGGSVQRVFAGDVMLGEG
jgi:BirA family biotin operon repressor/biotin-[acetyl-CoA-carboxylase] ligase